MMEISLNTEAPFNSDFKEQTGINTPEQSASETSTPNKKAGNDSDSASPLTPETESTPTQLQNQTSGGSSSGKKTRYKGKGLDANGRPRNFYNPPGKVLRSLANQSYYDSFYGNAGQVYTLKQKYKTQLCKHYVESEECPLHQFCQFAHGGHELRQANDPLPQNFGKTALGAVHSNYKTEPCKYMQKEGKCPFGEGCSFFHDDEEKRKLIDPLPNLPEGVTLPPMPEKIRNNHRNGKFNNTYSGNKNNNWSGDQNGQAGASISPFQFSPLNQQPPPSLIQITSFAEMAAFGGFNPNKYLSPAPINMQSQIQQIQFNGQPSQMFVAPPMQMNPMMNTQAQNQGQGKQGYNNNRSPKGKNTQQRYEKKDNQKSGKKGEKNQTEQKKYTPKQKKNTSAPKTEAPVASEQPAPVKVADIGASQ